MRPIRTYTTDHGVTVELLDVRFDKNVAYLRRGSGTEFKRTVEWLLEHTQSGFLEPEAPGEPLQRACPTS